MYRCAGLPQLTYITNILFRTVESDCGAHAAGNDTIRHQNVEYDKKYLRFFFLTSTYMRLESDFREMRDMHSVFRLPQKNVSSMCPQIPAVASSVLREKLRLNAWKTLHPL